MEVSRSLKDDISEGDAYGDIGMCLYCLGNYKEALVMHRQHVDLSSQENNKLTMSIALGNIGSCLIKTGDLKKAKIAIQNQIAVSKSINDFYGIANGFARYAQCLHMEGNFTEAREAYNCCLDSCLIYGDMFIIGLAQTNIGLCYHNMKAYNEALLSFQCAVEIFMKLQEHEMKLGALHIYMATSAFLYGKYQLSINKSMEALSSFELLYEKEQPESQKNSTLIDNMRKSYRLLALSQIFAGLHTESLLTTEREKRMLFQCIPKKINPNKAENDFPYNETNLLRAIGTLGIPILKYQLLQIDAYNTYLVCWCILPQRTEEGDNVIVNCKPIHFSAREKFKDVRQWVSHCRTLLGLGGW